MPNQLERDLSKLEGLLYGLSEKYPDILRGAVSARIAYEVAFANAVDSISHEAVTVGQKAPTVAEKEAMATIRTEAEYRDYRECDSEVDILKKKIDIYGDILGSTQSRVKLELAERGASGMAS